MNEAEHHQHPDPDFESGGNGDDAREIPYGVNVPDPSQIFKTWHLWLVYGLTIVTLGLSVTVAYNVTTTNAVDRQLRNVVAENRSVLCDLAALRHSTPPVTPREKATDRYFATHRDDCTRATP